MRLGLLAALLVTACYSPPQSDPACSITCTDGAGDSCPADLTCQGGYCVGEGQVCRPTFRQVAAATGFACAIDDQGDLWCWGSLNHSSVAARFDTTHHWDAIDGGGGQMCGISAGALYCWGENDDREVSGTIVGDVAQPLAIVATGVTTWTAVSAGADYTCAIGDGKLLCWGRNDVGQLGDGTGMDRAVPTPIDSTLNDWTDVATGDTHACAVSASNGVYCWGKSTFGEVGPGGQSARPVSVTMAGVPFMASAVAVSGLSSCAIASAGDLYCWGTNYNGEFGDPMFASPATVGQSAEPVRGSDLTFKKIDGAQGHFCALSGDAVYCWGGGNLGAGVWGDFRVFTKVIASGATDLSVASARDNITTYADLDLSCAIVGDETQCWGDNRYGQLGQGTATLATTPTEVAGGHMWKTLAGGAEHSCGIAEDNALYCWGSTIRGQATGFIYGSAVPRTPCTNNPAVPTEPLCDVARPRALNYASAPVMVTAGLAHTCVLSNGTTSCWGNGFGGANPAKRDLTQPGGASWKSLFQTGGNALCGRADAAGSPVYCIGSVLTSSLNVIAVPELDGFQAMAFADLGYGVFLNGAGTYFGVGDNSRVQLGDGAAQGSYPTLTQIGDHTYSSISALHDFTCALTPTATVECWGTNGRSQTGQAPSVWTQVPTTVPGLSSCTAVATGYEHACALCGNTISCWGNNRYGELAQPPSPDPVTLPRTVGIDLPGDPWVQLSAGYRHTCARSQAGHVYCWGFADRGALGNGGVGANLPVAVRVTPAT